MDAKNLIRVGKVSSIDYDKGTVRVLLEDKNNIVTGNLPYLSFEYEMPEVGESVLCLFLGNGTSRGVCLGRYFYLQDLPAQSGKDIYFKQFLREASLKYDRGSKTLTIDGKTNVVINGAENVDIKGATSAKLEGSSSVTIEGGVVNLGVGAGEPVLKGATAAGIYNGHIHIGNLGKPVSAPPVPIDGALSGKVMTE